MCNKKDRTDDGAIASYSEFTQSHYFRTWFPLKTLACAPNKRTAGDEMVFIFIFFLKECASCCSVPPAIKEKNCWR